MSANGNENVNPRTIAAMDDPKLIPGSKIPEIARMKPGVAADAITPTAMQGASLLTEIVIDVR
jgi:hypothetical protein